MKPNVHSMPIKYLGDACFGRLLLFHPKVGGTTSIVQVQLFCIYGGVRSYYPMSPILIMYQEIPEKNIFSKFR